MISQNIISPICVEKGKRQSRQTAVNVKDGTKDSSSGQSLALRFPSTVHDSFISRPGFPEGEWCQIDKPSYSCRSSQGKKPENNNTFPLKIER